MSDTGPRTRSVLAYARTKLNAALREVGGDTEDRYTAKVNRAIVQYRTAARKEAEAQLLREDCSRILAGVSNDELRDYVRETSAIDEQVEATLDNIAHLRGYEA